MKKLKFLIAQYGTSNLNYIPYSSKINEEYCIKKGYTYHLFKDDETIKGFCSEEKIAFQWYKVKFLKDLLVDFEEYDYILFLDMDAIISDSNLELEDVVQSEFNFYMSDDYSHHSKYNTGVILVKNDEWSKNFLNIWWESRNNTTGVEVKNKLDFDGGMHKPSDPTIFKYSAWHEQTALSLLCHNAPEYNERIKILPKERFNSYVYNNNEAIFHAFGYNFDQYRGLKSILDSRLASPLEKEEIRVVFFAYCSGSYLKIIEEDLKRIKDSGLYSKVSKIFLVLSLPNANDTTPVDKVKNIANNYPKVEISTCTGNKFEHYGIVKAWEEAHKYDGQLLYFHAKGVTGFYSNKSDHSTWKEQGDESFKEMLKFFTIDKHEDCLERLQIYDEVCVSDSYARGWPSGNFWWVNTKFLRKVHFPFESNYDRWACEYWLNRRNDNYSTFQMYDRFYYRDKFTYLPEDSYKNLDKLKDKKIILNYAKLVTLMEPENENDMNRPDSDHAVDFTEFVGNNLKENNYKGFSDIKVSFNTMGRTIPDPLYGTLKSLVISFFIEGDETEYRLVGDEGAHLTYFIDKYKAVGYDYSKNTDKKIREIIQKY